MVTQTSTPAADVEFAHHPVIPPIIRPRVPRVDPDLVARLRPIPVPDLSDAVGPLYTMAPEIAALYSAAPRLVGQALTVKMPAGDNLTVHGALGMAEDGDVLVIDARGYTDGCATGATALEAPILRGLAGAVVDGAWRDIEDIEARGFPVYGRGRAAFSPPKDRPGELNVPVSCGGVIVNPGDFVVADAEGVVVIPQEWILPVLAHVEERGALERSLGTEREAVERAAAARTAAFNRIVVANGGDPLDEPR